MFVCYLFRFYACIFVDLVQCSALTIVCEIRSYRKDRYHHYYSQQNTPTLTWDHYHHYYSQQNTPTLTWDHYHHYYSQQNTPTLTWDHSITTTHNKTRLH